MIMEHNVISYLKDIFPERGSFDDVVVERIGGMTNCNFKVTLDGKSYVLRIPGNGTGGMIERRNEAVNSSVSHRMGISPDVMYFNEGSGIKLTEFIENAETLNPRKIQTKENLAKVADIFRKLHQAEESLNNEFNVFREILSYENLMVAAGAQMYDGYDGIREDVFKLQHRLEVLGSEVRPCHNDPVPENFIKDSHGRLYLIDWEYSGMNDPMWDFAALFLESGFTVENRMFVLKRYLGREPDDVVVEKILVYQILMDVLWSIWTCIKEAQGDDFGTYGQNRFIRAVRNMNQWKEVYA